jgi:hypothetical protein
MIAKFGVAWTLAVSMLCSRPVAADDCRKVMAKLRMGPDSTKGDQPSQFADRSMRKVFAGQGLPITVIYMPMPR